MQAVVLQTGKIANCTPDNTNIYFKLYREHQNCTPKISVVIWLRPDWKICSAHGRSAWI